MPVSPFFHKGFLLSTRGGDLRTRDTSRCRVCFSWVSASSSLSLPPQVILFFSDRPAEMWSTFFDAVGFTTAHSVVTLPPVVAGFRWFFLVPEGGSPFPISVWPGPDISFLPGPPGLIAYPSTALFVSPSGKPPHPNPPPTPSGQYVLGVLGWLAPLESF